MFRAEMHEQHYVATLVGAGCGLLDYVKQEIIVKLKFNLIRTIFFGDNDGIKRQDP